MLQATIERTWDGVPVGDDERVELIARVDGEVLIVHVDAPFHGDPAPTVPAGRLPRLWEHEVVELFLVGRDECYLELELGPYGHYLALQLHGRRKIVDDALELSYSAERAGTRWSGRAALPLPWLPDPVERWNAFAIHGNGTARRYLAATPVPGPEPDFHRLAAFPRLPTP